MVMASAVQATPPSGSSSADATPAYSPTTCSIPLDPTTQLYLPPKSQSLNLIADANDSLQNELDMVKVQLGRVNREIGAVERELEDRLERYAMRGWHDGIILHQGMNPGAIKNMPFLDANNGGANLDARKQG
eukprot:CAMPEP_0117450608 /NCGR_PEP_ID=MMETSP0759-20121206/8559_1 /TAXON_ID=63605 /ORGANISM="Percolomonas cosmopolitus, Strain WS" /LENGTH=131 /DNA_ID=CAMNT_0005243141 /DNA_START=279 /DNA_END=674 /DNA_ORIENTATION=+